jgi:hypothetical protein
MTEDISTYFFPTENYSAFKDSDQILITVCHKNAEKSSGVDIGRVGRFLCLFNDKAGVSPSACFMA